MKIFLLSVLLFGFSAHAFAQAAPPNLPTNEELARDNNLFLSLARKMLKWDVPAEPIKIVGPLYFVGTQGLSAWLFATSDGHILLNTGMPESGPLVIASIRKLGFLSLRTSRS